jgi:hypothetical protein
VKEARREKTNETRDRAKSGVSVFGDSFGFGVAFTLSVLSACARLALPLPIPASRVGSASRVRA